MTAQSAIRPERPGDAPAVRTVLEAAFGGKIEADLVDRLRAGGHVVLALIAERAGEVVGHVAFSRLGLSSRGQAGVAAGLAPLAVSPEHQRQGIGGALVRAGLAELRSAGERIVFVLGDPAYYGRFGFRSMDGYVSPYAGPAFQALKLAPDAASSGIVTYPAPFAEI